MLSRRCGLRDVIAKWASLWDGRSAREELSTVAADIGGGDLSSRRAESCACGERRRRIVQASGLR
jgi:hypothetical protein